MKPNSGSSIKDAIGRIEKRLNALEQKSEWCELALAMAVVLHRLGTDM
jgi:hypothetical protein